MDNSRGPVELTGSVAPGDILLALNRTDLDDLGIEGAVQALRVLEENSAENVKLRFKYGDDIPATNASLRRGADILDMFGTSDGSDEVVTSPAATKMRTSRVAPPISSAEEIQKALKAQSTYPSCRPTSIFSGVDGYNSQLLEYEVRGLVLKGRIPASTSHASSLDDGSFAGNLGQAFDEIRNSLKTSIAPPIVSKPDVLDELWIADEETSLDDELRQLVSQSAHAKDSFKRRSSRGESTSSLRGLLPAKAITDRMMLGATKALRYGNEEHFEQLRFALENWTQSFLPTAAFSRHSHQADRELLTHTRDLVTLFVVMNVSWEFVCMGASPDTGASEFSRPSIPALGLNIGLFRHRPGGSLWTDRSAAKYIASLEAAYLRVDVVLAACAAVNFSESIREVLAAASKASSLHIDLSPEDAALPLNAVAAKIMGGIGGDLTPSHLGLVLMKNMEGIVRRSPDLFVDLAVLAFPVLRPAPLHRVILEGRVPRKNRLYATYMLRLLESDSCGCLADGQCVLELAAAIVDLSRVDANAAAAFLGPLGGVLRRSVDEAADLVETGVLLLREGLLSLASPVLTRCLQHDHSAARRERLLAAVRECVLQELGSEGGELVTLVEAYHAAVRAPACWDSDENNDALHPPGNSRGTCSNES